jgi:polyisoprenoid-binding protein YceI
VPPHTPTWIGVLSAASIRVFETNDQTVDQHRRTAMTSGRTLLAATLGAFVLTGSVASHAAPTYEIDPVHSSVVFKVKHRDVVFVYGRFNNVSGTIVTDKLRSFSTVEITAEVDTASIDTNSRERDKHLKSSEFFNASKNRKISFKTKSSKEVEDDRFELVGDLTLCGVTKEVTVVFEVTGTGKGDMVWLLGGHATFTIKRSEFGMDAMIPDIADEVTLMVGLNGLFNIPPSG